jgi:PAS domain-containing protein
MRSSRLTATIICFWNPDAERIFDYNRADAIGRSLDLIIPEPAATRRTHGRQQDRSMVCGVAYSHPCIPDCEIVAGAARR